MSLTQELINIGLSNKEADVYLATLQLGYATIVEISLKTNINRTTVYTHIKNLINRGLINASEKNGKIYFVAERPEKLQIIYEQKEKELQRKRQMLNNIMPELDTLYQLAKDRPKVKYIDYRNQNELNLVREEIQNIRTDEMLNIFNYEEFKEYINRQHIEKILENVNKFKAIYIARNRIVDLKIRKFINNDKLEIRYLPADRFNFLYELLIVDDKVYLSRSSNSIYIKDNLFSQTLMLLFQALWELAEEI